MRWLGPVPVLAIWLTGACNLKDKDTGDDVVVPGDGATASCAELAAKLHDRARTTPIDCRVASDCESVGFPAGPDGAPTCNCGVTFSMTCGGDVVNSAAWRSDPVAQALLAQWTERCVRGGDPTGAPTLCDCGPGPRACFENACIGSEQSCFLLDAGMP